MIYLLRCRPNRKGPVMCPLQVAGVPDRKGWNLQGWLMCLGGNFAVGRGWGA